MAKTKKRKSKTSAAGALLPNNIYACKKAKPKRPSKKAVMLHEAKLHRESSKAIEKGKKMALIEAYAKKHEVSITQAMIHFM